MNNENKDKVNVREFFNKYLNLPDVFIADKEEHKTLTPEDLCFEEFIPKGSKPEQLKLPEETTEGIASKLIYPDH
ncbi:hypothetical protein C7H19_15135 [Aphanothece hegewaldii CCALA 016]|uniref:Uncharacterized protein n=1 Tax=Aphanothece hegewaldii CCALA 016 TaxID=2107694 RepID=A0A2T1LVJ8_9CHRO|nr:hypothetical protein [Aphanothece hegewaldii]PSF35758.1 hypothetical protein C7H19_15135 [Aphanothece hegewaldii CCALA 016]